MWWYNSKIGMRGDPTENVLAPIISPPSSVSAAALGPPAFALHPYAVMAVFTTAGGSVA